MIAHNHVSHIAVVIGAFSVSAFADRRMYSYRQSRLCMFEKLLFPFSPVNPISERQHASRAIESILTDNETSPKPKSPESLTQPTTLQEARDTRNNTISKRRTETTGRKTKKQARGNLV